MSKLQRQAAIHSNVSPEWYSPPEVSDGFEFIFRKRPDFDPASSAIANKQIRAKLFFSEQGLEREWPLLAEDGTPAKGFENPPSPPKMWWKKTIEWWLGQRQDRDLESGRAMLYVAYSIEQAQQSQHWTPQHPVQHFPHCTPKSRVRFWCSVRDALMKLGDRLDKYETQIATEQEALAEEQAGLQGSQDAHDEEGIEKAEAAVAACEKEIERLQSYARPLYKQREKLEQLDPDTIVPGDQPTHSSMYVLIGGSGEETERFATFFDRIGCVVIP